MDNKKIAEVFEEIADILDISGANPFRINAYRRAALTILNLTHDLKDAVRDDPRQLAAIPGIGKVIIEKIIELVESGKCKEHEKLKRSIPMGLLEMLHIRTLGPKKVKMLFLNLAIKNISELKKAAEKGLISTLPGMGKKSEAEILKAIKEYKLFSTKRSYINVARTEAASIIDYMRKCKLVDEIQFAGSLRRYKETVGDIDILVTLKRDKRAEVMDYFVEYEDVYKIIARGDTKSSVILSGGLQVDLRVVPNESFGAALHYFTGSKEHNIRIRDLAKRRGLKVNEYGVYKGVKQISGEKEEDIFRAVGLPFIVPEMREDNGEIEYGLKHKKMPKLLELGDIKGDLHVHSKYSDGDNTIEEMALAYMKMGYEYFAMTDHSALVGIAGGMNKNKIFKQWKEIDRLNKKLPIKILKGCEVDILKDGSLDFDDEVLKQLEIVLISAHMYGRLDYDTQTKRLIRAIENPYSKVLCHPSGRLINKRAPMDFDMDKIIKACVLNKVALEINANPMRLDLNDRYIRAAKEQGAKFVISTDAHSVDNALFIEYGVGMARKAWLGKDDILNAQSFRSLTAIFRDV